MTSELKDISDSIKKFIQDRDWEQFHSLKNISMSISIEAAELMEHFQWSRADQEMKEILENKDKRTDIEDEVADIAIYLIDFCNMADIDLKQVIFNKLEKNAKKYPEGIVRGRNEKYTHYQSNA